MLHYKTSGNNQQAIVLLHGFCQNSTCFNEQVLFLKHFYNIVTIDLPGFGQSQIVPNITMFKMAAMVNDVLQHLNINKSLMLGHSMGGYVTLAYTKLFSDKLTGFGLLHSTAAADTPERKEKRKQVIAFIHKYGVEPYINNFIPSLFAEPNKNKAYIKEAVNAGLQCSADGIIAAANAMMLREDSFDLLKQTKLPVFFGAGRYDSLIHYHDIFNQASKVSVSKICFMPNSGHMGMQEEPEILNRAIFDFANYCYNI